MKYRFDQDGVVDLARPSRLGWVTMLGFAAITVLEKRAARAGDVAAQLEYTAVPGCPVAADFEAVVAGRLGYSPFRAEAFERVVVKIEAAGRTLAGRLEWRDDTGAWAGERSFPSRTGDCGELVRAMGFALALQFQLLATVAPAASPSPAGGPAASTTATAAPPAPTVASSPLANNQPEPAAAGSPSGPSIAAGVGASAGIGLSPRVDAIGRLFGAVAWSRAAVELAAEVSLPTEMHLSDGTGFSHQLLAVGMAGCGLRTRWSACLLARVGQIRVVGKNIDIPRTDSGFLVQTGLRLAVTQMLGRRAYIVVRGDGLTLVTRGIVTLDAIPVWTTPRVAAVLGLDFGLLFP